MTRQKIGSNFVLLLCVPYISIISEYESLTTFEKAKLQAVVVPVGESRNIAHSAKIRWAKERT